MSDRNESRADRVLRLLMRAGKSAPSLDTAKLALGFETRLMATVRARRAAEETPWWLWNRVVWRLVPVLTAVVLVLAAISFWGTNGKDPLASWHDPLGLDLALVDRFLGSDL